jgi:hypothetical protein
VIAALSAWHDAHEAAARAIAGVRALPAHVLIEAYSVLTRLPGGLALPAQAAFELLDRRFDEPPLALSASQRRRALGPLATAGIAGGATYDGLVGLEANAHGRTLITLDRRAQETYRRLGVPFRGL